MTLVWPASNGGAVDTGARHAVGCAVVSTALSIGTLFADVAAARMAPI